MNVVFIRHGKTEGNLHRRYIGRTDEPLCETGRQEISQKLDRYPHTDILYTSTKKRCLETAARIYPDLAPICVSGFDECDFGEFEGKNYLELSDNVNYQRWIDSNGTLPFPGGETVEEFKQRCRETFVKIANELLKKATEKNSGESDLPIATAGGDAQETTVAFVVHGGTIMAIFSAFAEEKKGYYDWQIKNSEGLTAELEMNEGEPLLKAVRLI